MPLTEITGAEVDVLRGPRGLTGATGASGGGSGGVELPDIPSQAEAELGSDNTKMMTPLRTAQSVASRLTPYVTFGGLDAQILSYLTAAELWIPDTSQANQMLSGDSTHGVKFRSDLIAEDLHPINRMVWTPRSAGVPAIDITPRGASPEPVGGRLGWHEFCSKEFLGLGAGDPFHSMRLSVLDDGGQLGTFLFNGETGGKKINLIVDGNTVGALNQYGNLYTLGGARSGTYTIADDAVQAIAVPTAADPKWAILAISRNAASAPSPFGFLRIKAGTGAIAPAEIAMAPPTSGSTAIVYTTGVLTAVTNDGTITISAHTDGFVYIQNRMGASILIGTYWMIQSN